MPLPIASSWKFCYPGHWVECPSCGKSQGSKAGPRTLVSVRRVVQGAVAEPGGTIQRCKECGVFFEKHQTPVRGSG